MAEKHSSKKELKNTKKINRILIAALIFMVLVAVILGIALYEAKQDKPRDTSLTVTPTNEPVPSINVTQPIETPTEAEQIPTTAPTEVPSEAPTGTLVEDVSPTPEITPTAEVIPSEAPTPTETLPTETPTPSDIPTPTTAAPNPTTAVPTPTEAAATPTQTPTTAVTPTPTTAATPTPTTAAPTPTPKQVASGTPVSQHGRLSVKGTRLVDKNGKAVQLKGVSTHGLQWFPQFVCKETFKCIRDEWGANCVRLAMYTDEGGYCNGADQAQMRTLVKNGVKYATELGLYVIIDWHILHDYDPNMNKADAIKFFDEMSKEFAGCENVFYEICNEPNGGISWAPVKSYAEEIVPVIRKNDPKGIIIIGTPTWSQDVDIAAKDPVKGYDNLMYALHFYAGTHKDNIRSKMKTAIEAGLPVIVTEYGICDASGNGACNETEANKWVAMMDKYGVSYMIWNLANKNESSSLIKANCKKLSGFTEADLNQEGRWLVKMLGGQLPKMTEEELKKLESDAGGSGGGDVAVPDGIEKIVDQNGLHLELTTQNTWNETASKCYQFSVLIENKNTSQKKDWVIKVTFNSDVSSDNFWCCNAKFEKNVMTLTPAEFNRTLSAGAQTSDIGLIVQSKSLLKIQSIEITAK